jgi:hypothetical protein
MQILRFEKALAPLWNEGLFEDITQIIEYLYHCFIDSATIDFASSSVSQ